MTKEQFNALKVGDEVDIYSQRLIVTHINKKELLISACPESILIASSPNHKPIWYRYENCELVVEDRLLEYLYRADVKNPKDRASDIRSIVRKEVIDGLKFPSYGEFIAYWKDNSIKDSHDWFITETKRLNGG